MDVLTEQIMGCFLMVLGLGLVIQPRAWISYARTLIKHPAHLVPIGIITLLLGLFVVFAHPQMDSPTAIVTSLFGWLMLIKGTAILCLPMTLMRYYPIKVLKKPVLMVEGVILIGLGLWVYYPTIA